MKGLSLATITIFALAISSARAQENPILKMEQSYRENALKADATYKGKSATLQCYFNSAEKEGAKIRLVSSIIFYDTGLQVIFRSLLKDGQGAGAMALKPEDLIEITGTLKKRVVKTKDRNEVSTIGDRVYGGTVTDVWSEYELEAVKIKLIESKAERLRKAEAAKNKVDSLQKEFMAAMQKEDLPAAMKLFENGLEASFMDQLVDEVAAADEKKPEYPNYIKFFKFIMKTNKANFDRTFKYALGIDPGRGIFPGGTMRMRQRPELFRVMDELKMINYSGKFASGDTLLHYLVKDPIMVNFEKSTDRLNGLMFSESDLAIIRIISKSPEAAGCTKIKDAYGKTLLEYFEPEPSSFGLNKHYAELRKLIQAIPDKAE